MPIVRLSRDKRGLDTLYLIDTRADARRSGGSRVLYFWTAPPGMRVGRGALDESRQRELERIHPDLVFDWPELHKSAEAARQQAAAVLMTPEARREAWRGAGRSPKGSQRPATRTTDSAPVTIAPVAGASAPSSVTSPAPKATMLGAPPTDALLPTTDDPDASNLTDPPGTRPPPRRRRRPRRTGDSNETAQPAAPIIES